MVPSPITEGTSRILSADMESTANLEPHPSEAPSPFEVNHGRSKQVGWMRSTYLTYSYSVVGSR